MCGANVARGERWACYSSSTILRFGAIAQR
jgi:hypothetical protein